MKRKVLIAVGILCICLFVSGCGVNKEKESASQEVAIAQETEEVTETL